MMDITEGIEMKDRKCKECGGNGFLFDSLSSLKAGYSDECQHCNGTGKEPEDNQDDVNKSFLKYRDNDPYGRIKTEELIPCFIDYQVILKR